VFDELSLFYYEVKLEFANALGLFRPDLNLEFILFSIDVFWLFYGF
jgi:hypothetical protein